jgi:hypothetical protein
VHTVPVADRAKAHIRRPIAAPVVVGAAALATCVGFALVDPDGGPVLCPFRAATGLACPGCGSTRMLHRLATGDPAGAFLLNPLAFVMLPLVAWWLFVGFTARLGGPRWRTPQFSAAATWVLAVATVAFWVVRNLPPFHSISSL